MGKVGRQQYGGLHFKPGTQSVPLKHKPTGRASGSTRARLMGTPNPLKVLPYGAADQGWCLTVWRSIDTNAEPRGSTACLCNQHDDDPSAGSPTETLLRLLLPLDILVR